MGVTMERFAGQQQMRVRPQLLLLFVFTLLLGLLNVMVINQRTILYLFYFPVVFAAWIFARREAIGVAVLAALLVVAYALFFPQHLMGKSGRLFMWADVAIWGGVLVVTAYMVATLRAWTAEAMRNLQQAYAGVLAILSKFIQTVDTDTEAHSVRVSAWCVRIAQAMGLKKSVVEEARIAGMLHDVGKVDVSVDLLRKAASLSVLEKEDIRMHTVRGATLVESVGGMLTNIADAIECHHEKYDGSGYYGRKDGAIPQVARIIAVADALDALVSDRPYRKGTSLFKAVDVITAASGTHFDPDVVAALKQIVYKDGDSAIASVADEVAS